MARVVVIDHVFDDLELTRETLLPLGVEVVEASAADEATLVDVVRDASALMVCYAPIPRAVVRAASEGGCKVIARTGIGVDNVDVEEATRLGIQVTNVPDYCLDEVADHAITLLLAAARGLLEASRTVADGGWTAPTGVHRLSGRRLALVGVGAIGERVAVRARAFGFEIVGYDPFRAAWDGSAARPVASIADAVVEADAISLHAPLTKETHNLVDDAFLDSLQRRPVLVNTSRGGLVDLDAVVRALDDGRLEAACLDVTDPEPPRADHPIRTHPRAIVTPHMAFYSIEAQHELQRRAAEEIARALTGEAARSPVNRPAKLAGAGGGV